MLEDDVCKILAGNSNLSQSYGLLKGGVNFADQPCSSYCFLKL